ncbi:methylenetetrahydrofolate reductase-domain-containing protein [Mycena floridula]|nr:methylenetetrahydrofolate reductase-domain-containing protein [Mycena floridula]
MKLTDKFAGRDPAHPFYFFEFFPPRTEQGFQNLLPRIARLGKLDPLAISVTWGAGGSTKDRSLDLAGLIQSEYNLDTILHLTCTNMMQGMVDVVLGAAKDRGIQNILALRGDPPRGKEEWIPVDPRFQHGVDLVSYIRSSPEFSSHFCIGVAGYPDGHADNLGHSEEEEIQFLKAKVDAGADFIITQLFYDVDQFLRWVEKLRTNGIKVPIIPGIMPIQNYSSFQRVTKLCGTRLPPSLLAELEEIKHDDQLVKEYGIKLAVDMIRRITVEGKIPGVHFCTLNLEKSVQRVLESLQWTGVAPTTHNRLISESEGVNGPSQLKVTPSSATTTAEQGLASIPSTQAEAGSGELNNAASWDDFPNGRFGDFKSPAFGDTGPGGISLSGVKSDSVSQWGQPQSFDDLTKIFLDHLHSKIPSTPFSPTALSPESLMILPHLEKLNQRGWWTVGSQPSVDSARSADEIVGWGPRSGYVFQKGFVEFFCEEEDVDIIEKKVLEKSKGRVHWFAGNSKGDCRSNVSDDGRNAVTWGIFPGQEVVQTTIIERESFLSWKDEAFSIWSEWASFHRPGSVERQVLDSVKSQRWLVSIVHHDYKDTDALWKFLFDDLS